MPGGRIQNGLQELESNSQCQSGEKLTPFHPPALERLHILVRVESASLALSQHMGKYGCLGLDITFRQ